MSLRSPLGRVLGHGSAKDGTEHFVSQRISAIALALLGCWFAVEMLLLDSMAYLEIVRFIAEPMNTILLVLLSLTVAWHSYLGVQVVVEDYVHTPGIRHLTLVAARFAHALVAVAAVYAVLRIGLN